MKCTLILPSRKLIKYWNISVLAIKDEPNTWLYYLVSLVLMTSSRDLTFEMSIQARVHICTVSLLIIPGLHTCQTRMYTCQACYSKINHNSTQFSNTHSIEVSYLYRTQPGFVSCWTGRVTHARLVHHSLNLNTIHMHGIYGKQ